jgi:hypothetical protein
MAAVVVAIRTSTDPGAWVDDPRALATAIGLLAEADARARRRGR